MQKPVQVGLVKQVLTQDDLIHTCQHTMQYTTTTLLYFEHYAAVLHLVQPRSMFITCADMLLYYNNDLLVNKPLSRKPQRHSNSCCCHGQCLSKIPDCVYAPML